MPLWAWLAVALSIGVLFGIEAWAWLRHGTSAIVIAVSGIATIAMSLVGVAIFALIALGIVAGATGINLGLTETSAGGKCDPNYKGECLDPDVSDYDCAGGSGDGPEYVGTVRVVGHDHHGLDRDGNGVGCE